MSLSTNLPAQTILIDSTFDADGEIFPFGQTDTIYGLSISGSLELFSDTSLIRVILQDTNGVSWMVYEAYPMIVMDTSFDIVEECDETCYLDEFQPYSLKVQIINADLVLDSINYSEEGTGDMEAIQYQAKRSKDLEKVQVMNQYINDRGWEWEADTTNIVNMFFHEKTEIFKYKYNLLGLDYYAGGFFKNERLGNPMIDHTTLTRYFNWKEKHDAHLETSLYFDGNLDIHRVNNQVITEQGNGWMTGVRDQDPCYACVAFGSVASFEAVVNLYFNQHIDSTYGLRLSERHAYNCTPYGTNQVGCNCDNGKVFGDGFF